MSGIAKAASPAYKRPYRMVVGRNTLDDLIDGHAAMNVALQGAKTVYYCEGNAGLDTNTGVGGWENAFKTLTVALAASHADIATNKYGWAARNVILCRGDAFDEDLVLLAQKTDVIGLGSYNANDQCGLIGNHVPTGTTASYGTRFFNFYFTGNAAGGDIWTFDITMNSFEFHGCSFSADTTTACTGAIINAGGDFLGVYNCEFVGKFTDAVIEFGTGDGARGLRIVGNFIEGDNVGIELASATTISTGATEKYALIKDNVICVAGLTIDDNSGGGGGVTHVIGNHLISEATTTATAVDINLPTAAANYLSFATVNSIYPYDDASS